MLLLFSGQVFEHLFGNRIGIFGAGLGPFVVQVDAFFLHFGGFFEHLFYVVDLFHFLGGLHLDFAFEEKDALGQALHVHHLGDGRAAEDFRQRIVSVVVAIEVEVHVLVYGSQFVGYCAVEQLDAFFSDFHTIKIFRLFECVFLCV